MKDLSIIIRSNSDKITEYINSLEPIFHNVNPELIIINNSIDSLDINYDYTLYKFSGGYREFKEFCFASSSSSRVIIIDGNIQLNQPIVDDIIGNIKRDDFKNTSYKFRKFLSSERPIFYMSSQVLIYNRGIKGFNIYSDMTINDFTLTDRDFMEINLNRLIEEKNFNEMYLWYKHFILNQPRDFRQKFYLLIEYEKTRLQYEDRKYIEELFSLSNDDMEYYEYLMTKKSFSSESNLSAASLNETLKTISLEKGLFYSYIIYWIIVERHDLSSLIACVDKEFLKSSMEYLLNNTDLHEHLYDFILSINNPSMENEDIQLSSSNIFLITSYILYASKHHIDPDLKNKLLNLFQIYMNIESKLTRDADELNEWHGNNIAAVYNRALEYFNNGDTESATEIFKSLSYKYPEYEMLFRYAIQNIRYKSGCYKYKISICIIARDEEKNIGRCLSSLMPLINSDAELIIVDTGSVDKTVEIANEYTDRIYFFAWNGSFSDARNYCISIAQGEYIFILDADEEIESEEIDKILDVFNSPEYKSFNTFTVKIKNYTDINLNEYAVLTQPRIFRNTPDFYYFGNVHNQPMFKLPIKHLPIFVKHYGYIMTEDIKDKKFQRTSNLLKLELQKNPNNIYYRFQLSTSYAMHGDLKEALAQAQIYMRIIREEGHCNDSHIMYYNNAAILYISSKLYSEALDICNDALEISPNYIDFIYYKAIIYYKTEDYENAVEYADKYLGIIDKFMDMDIANDGRYSFYSLGQKNEVLKMKVLSLHRLGEYDEIINTSRKMGPSCQKQCLHAILNSIIKTSGYSKVAELFSILCSDDNSSIIFRYFLRYYIQKLKPEEMKLYSDILSHGSSFENKSGTPEEHRNLNEYNEAFFVLDNYDIDSLDLSELKALLSKLLPAYNSIDIKNLSDVSEIMKFRKLGSYILKHSLQLRHYKDFSPVKQINIFKKYMDLSSNLIKGNRANLISAGEKLFLLKITEAFREYGRGNNDVAAKLMINAAEIYNPMEGIVELIIKNVLPEYKNAFRSKNTSTVISDRSEDVVSYANMVKKEIINAAEKGRGEILEVFSRFNNRELYDAEVISYKSLLLMSEGMIDNAENELRMGLITYPNDIRLLTNLARLYSITKRYNESIEVFCRIELLYREKSNLTLSELVPQDFYIKKPSSPKILHGTMFADNRVSRITSMLSKKGMYVRTINYCPKFTGYGFDYVIDMNQYENGNVILSRTVDAASILIPEFDIFHFHYGSSLTFDHSDLPLLKELGKKVVMQFYGDEVNPANAAKALTVERKLTELSKYLSVCIVPNEEIYKFVKDYFSEVHIIEEDEIDSLIDLYKA